MLDDLTKEIKAQLYERVKSPLFGAFAFSWVAWNYRGLLAAISDMPFKDRMGYLDGLYPTGPDWLWHCLGGPLLTAVGLLLVYPWPARWIYSYWANQQKELKKVQQRIEDEMPITQEEANALRKAGIAQGKEYQAQLKELAADNKELKASMKLLQEENARLTTERDQFGEAAKKAQEQVAPALANVLAQHPPTVSTDPSVVFPKNAAHFLNEVSLDSLSEKQRMGLRDLLGAGEAVRLAFLSLVALDGDGDLDSIARGAGLSKIETRHGLDSLRQRELVSLTGGNWRLTADGRAAAVHLALTGGVKK